MMLKKFGQIQSGELLLEITPADEAGLLRAVTVHGHSRITDAIWFEDKQQAIAKLKKVLEELERGL